MAVLCDGLMAYWGQESIRATETMLRDAGFTVSKVCSSRPSCFDFAARKNKNLVFVKVQPDLGNLSSNDAEELRSIAEYISAASLLVSEKTRDKPLEDDTVYSRYNILAITTRTFESIALHNTKPLIQANPGGCYVEIDGETLKKRRQELRLSVGEMAEMIGISRRTLYGYERSMAKASVTTAYNMMWALGIPVAKPVDIFEKSKARHKCCLLSTARRVITRSKLLQKLFSKFARYDVTTVKKAPFDFVIDVPEEEMRIIGGLAIDKELQLDRRIDEILSLSKVVQAHPLLITTGQKTSHKGIRILECADLSQIKNPEDLILNIT